jgi:hypothetical protein
MSDIKDLCLATLPSRRSKGRRSVFFWALVALLCAIALIVSPSLLTFPTAAADDDAILSRLSTFISLGTSYLVRVSHTKEQDKKNPGKFTYIAYLKEDLPLDFNKHPVEEYNLLRHNGAIYSLALSYARQPNEQVLEAMRRSVNYLKDFAIGPVPDASATMTNDDHVFEKRPHIPNLLAAWETEKIVAGNGKPIAKLGGAGLALIALVSLEMIEPGTSDLTYLRQIGEFIKFMQAEDGSFTCRYKPHRGGKDDTWTSLYYPGEAALGLIYLASLEKDEVYKRKWVNVAVKALRYLEGIRRPEELEDVEPDHWALLATERLLPLLDPTSTDYWLVYEHGVKVVRGMVDVLTREELVKFGGCHTGSDARTCPTATRLEGLIAALSFVRPEERFVVDSQDKMENLRDRMIYFIELGIEFLLSSQETSTINNMQGGVPVKYPITEHQGSREVRVDYVQHSMSGMIAYERLLLSKKGKRLGGLRMPAVPNTLAGEASILPWFLLVLGVGALLGIGVMSLKKPKKLRTH